MPISVLIPFSAFRSFLNPPADGLTSCKVGGEYPSLYDAVTAQVLAMTLLIAILGMNIPSKQFIATENKFPSTPETEDHMRDKTGIEILIRQSPHTYASISVDIDSIAVAVRDHKVVMIGAYGTNDGWHVADVTHLGNTWGHAIAVVGAMMRNGKKCLKFLNSWSTSWGEGGYGYISEDYFISGGIMAAFVFTDNYIRPNPLIKETMIGYKKASDSKVYVNVGGIFVWVNSWEAFTALGGLDKTVVVLSDSEFSKFPTREDLNIALL